MQLYRRPPPPQGFPSSSWETTRQQAEQWIEQQLRKKRGKKAVVRKPAKRVSGKPKATKKDPFPNLWKGYKAVFAYAQFEKCGFCECSLLETSYGDVEHYRPKNAISTLREEQEALGIQQEASASIAERLLEPVCSTGYYWLAYDWSNYLLACTVCNGLKTTIFPVKDNPRAIPPLKTHKTEHPLLLNPFDSKAPSKHLKFKDDGFVMHRSPYGRATIQTCGLYRDTLQRARKRIAVRAFELARDLKRPAHRRENPELLRDCYEYGVEDAEHCGMVRCIFEEIAEVSWETLVKQRAKELALQSTTTKKADKKKVIDEHLEKMGRDRYEHAAAVRQIFEKTCRASWSTLVARHARQLARDFLACRADWEKDGKYQLNWMLKFYLLARDNPGHLGSARDAYEKATHLDWNELKAYVESSVRFLLTLPAD